MKKARVGLMFSSSCDKLRVTCRIVTTKSQGKKVTEVFRAHHILAPLCIKNQTRKECGDKNKGEGVGEGKL
jgi:hypothetical protein